MKRTRKERFSGSGALNLVGTEVNMFHPTFQEHQQSARRRSTSKSSGSCVALCSCCRPVSQPCKKKSREKLDENIFLVTAVAAAMQLQVMSAQDQWQKMKTLSGLDRIQQHEYKLRIEDCGLVHLFTEIISNITVTPLTAF